MKINKFYRNFLAVILVISFMFTGISSVYAAADGFYNSAESIVYINGALDEEYAGKMITLCMYKTGEEPTAENIGWIGQTKVLASGEYSFRFELADINSYTALINENNVNLTPSITRGTALHMIYDAKADISIVDDEARVNVTIKDVYAGGAENDCTIVAVFYDKDGNLVSVETIENETTKTLEGGKTFPLSVDESVESMKVLIWENLDSMLPYSNAIKADRNAYKSYINYRDDVSNIFKKLSTDKEATIAFIGGSVTQGTGASNEEAESWRGQISDWFESQYPDANIKTVNAAIGSSGSNLADFRLESEVLSQNPDMVFMMFFINDVYCQDNETDIKSHISSVVERIRSNNPNCDILMLFETEKGVPEYIASGETLHATARLQDNIASYYDITTINMGQAIFDYISSLEGGISANWSNYFADRVHPSDLGYDFYTNVIKQYLGEVQRKCDVSEPVKAYVMPDTPYASYKPTTMVVADDINTTENTGWTLSTVADVSKIGIYDRVFSSSAQGAQFTTEFTGTELAFLVYSAGSFTYSIDGGAEQTIWCSAADNRPKWVVRNLSDEKHNVTIKNALGGTINIYAILYR